MKKVYLRYHHLLCVVDVVKYTFACQINQHHQILLIDVNWLHAALQCVVLVRKQYQPIQG